MMKSYTTHHGQQLGLAPRQNVRWTDLHYKTPCREPTDGHAVGALYFTLVIECFLPIVRPPEHVRPAGCIGGQGTDRGLTDCEGPRYPHTVDDAAHMSLQDHTDQGLSVGIDGLV